MTRIFSLLVSWSSLVALILGATTLVWFLFDIESLAQLARNNVPLPIFWQSVDVWQWYVLWAMTTIYLGIGFAGLFFLRRAFQKFAEGESFSQESSRDLRLFSITLFAYGFAKPLYFSVMSVLLSFNHPPGEKVLSISLGSSEVQLIVLGMILWVISDLLVRANDLEKENKQFV